MTVNSGEVLREVAGEVYAAHLAGADGDLGQAALGIETPEGALLFALGHHEEVTSREGHQHDSSSGNLVRAEISGAIAGAMGVAPETPNPEGYQQKKEMWSPVLKALGISRDIPGMFDALIAGEDYDQVASRMGGGEGKMHYPKGEYQEARLIFDAARSRSMDLRRL